MKFLSTLFLFLLTLSVHAQVLSATDMLNLSNCTKPTCYAELMKERGFKFVPDTTAGAADTSTNKQYQYISKLSVDKRKHKNKVVFFVYNNGRFTAVMFTTKIEKMYRQLLNGFIAQGFAGGQMLYGEFEEKITYRSDYFPNADLLLISSKDFTGTKVLRYDFVLTTVR